MDNDFKQRMLAELDCNAKFRSDVRCDLGMLKTWVANEEAVRAYKKAFNKSLYQVIGCIVAIAGLAATFILN